MSKGASQNPLFSVATSASKSIHCFYNGAALAADGKRSYSRCFNIIRTEINTQVGATTKFGQTYWCADLKARINMRIWEVLGYLSTELWIKFVMAQSTENIIGTA